jgi:tRNA nucleotidyltransferase (CCA-adding enzyme)
MIATGLDKEDVDNAILFLEEILIDANIAYKRIHGSRDYFQFKKNNLNFELVPVKYVTSFEDVENVTDMSPLHVQWVVENIGDLSNDVRLAKQFCKAKNVYGAESYINGISGHVLDILIIHYGSFEKFIKEVSEWKEPVVIDYQKKHKDVFKELNEAKLKSPLIVIDPIDPSRNAAAALSREKFDLLKKSAHEFITNPSENDFEIKKFSINEIKETISENDQLFVIELIPLEGAKDVVGTKILKSYEFVRRELISNGFEIIKSGWNFNIEKSVLFFAIPKKELDKTYIRKGPPLNAIKGVEKFTEKHGSKCFEKNGFLFATIERKYTSPKKFLDNLIESEYLTSRSRSRKIFLM